MVDGGRAVVGRAARPNDGGGSGDSSSLVIGPNCAGKERRGQERRMPASQAVGRAARPANQAVTAKGLEEGEGMYRRRKRNLQTHAKKRGRERDSGGRPNAN